MFNDSSLLFYALLTGVRFCWWFMFGLRKQSLDDTNDQKPVVFFMSLFFLLKLAFF